METSGKEEYRTINTFDSGHGTLLKSAIIYGANGSGKSNLFEALAFMQTMALYSVIEGDAINRNNPFQFRENSKETPTVFEVVFVTKNVRYRYGFSVLHGKVNQEWLYRKVKRETILFRRTGAGVDSITLSGAMKAGESLKQHTRGSSLFLTVAAMFNDPVASEVVEWFRSLIISSSNAKPTRTFRYIEAAEANRKRVLNYLHQADTGIVDVLFDIKEIDSQSELRQPIEGISDLTLEIRHVQQKADIFTMHHLFGDSGDIIGQVQLPFSRQSEGTMAFLSLLGPVLQALEEGSVIVLDELGARMHPNLVKLVLSLFNSIGHNPNNAQLICNSHDVLLMNERIRRDQIWFVSKNEFGESDLYSLDDFADTRKDEPFVRKYLVGIFGAIPRLDQAVL